MLFDGICIWIESTSGISPVIGVGAFLQRTPRRLHQCRLQGLLALVGRRQIAGHEFGDEHRAIDERRAAADGELFLLNGVPRHHLHDLLGVGSRWRQVVSP